MSPSRGYWRRDVFPRLEAGVEKAGYGAALGEIIGAGCSQRGKKGSYNVGADVTRLLPLGKRSADAERNRTTQHVPRQAKSGLSNCLDYNAHSECNRGVQCNFAHDFVWWIFIGVSRPSFFGVCFFAKGKTLFGTQSKLML